MGSSLTVQSIIQYFENKLRRADGSMSGSQAGETPQYPMMVIYLDTGMGDGGAALAEDLTRLWPQFTGELHFLSVRPGQTPEYFEYIRREDGYASSPISAGEAAGLAAGLLGTGSHFTNYSKTILYFVLEAGGLRSVQEFDACVLSMAQAIRDIGIGRINLLTMLTVLLDESTGASIAVSGQIRNRIAQLLTEDALPGSLCLLSNRRYDNRVLTSRDTYLKMASAVIAVSNNRDATVVQDIFLNSKAFTVGYAREEKPTSDICQFLVTALIGRLAALPTAGAAMTDEKDLARRLGITPEGTIVTLDRYAQARFDPMLPTPQQLELFPRAECAEFYAAPESMSASEFDRQTMGAWSAYLAGIVNEARAGIDLNPMEARRMAGEYAAYLRSNITAGEFIWLNDHPEKVNACFAVTREPIRELPTLEYARQFLRYLLSANPNLRSLLREEVDRQAGEASGYLSEWQKLRSSVSSLHPIRQGEDFTTFYRALFNNYYYRNSNEINKSFLAASSREGLRTFFENTVDGMLHDDELRAPICASFESELHQRLTSSMSADNVSSRISYMLDPEQVPAYLQTSFSLGGAFRSFILMKRDNDPNSLYTALKLPSLTRVYNTGRSDAVEVLNLYSLSNDSILYGGAM